MGRKVKSLKLLPCPFCGQQPVVSEHKYGGRASVQVQCDDEGCTVNPTAGANYGPHKNGYATTRQAIKAWNTRKEAPNA